MSDGAADERAISFAAALAAARDGKLVLVNAVARSSGTPLGFAETVLDEHRAAARNSLRTAVDSSAGIRTHAAARVGRTVPVIARDVCEEFSAGIVVIDESKSPLPMSFGRSISVRVGSSVDCDVISVGGTHASPDISSILVPVAGGPHSGLAVD
ncbi:MAG TPA: universal stress protein, partial [Methanomicrobiales archaeon]|nr:universal stress protein [Methanomicrobiales archaeon]